MLVGRKSNASFIPAQFLSTSATAALLHGVPLVGIKYFAVHFTIMQARKQNTRSLKSMHECAFIDRQYKKYICECTIAGHLKPEKPTLQKNMGTV